MEEIKKQGRTLKSKVVIIAVIILALGAGTYYKISTDPKNRILPENLETASESLKEAVKNLPQEDREILVRYLFRKGVAKAFGADIPYVPVTIGEAIKEQKEFDLKKNQQAEEQEVLKKEIEAKRKELKTQLESILTLAFISKQYAEADYRRNVYQDFIAIKIAISNKGSKDITGFKGALVFKDIFDEEIISIGFSFDEGIKAGATTQWDGSIDYNQFKEEHRRFKDANSDKIKFEFLPETVIFSDGTKLEAGSL